jgi:DNA-binding GntR family transcriptional regulator
MMSRLALPETTLKDFGLIDRAAGAAAMNQARAAEVVEILREIEQELARFRAAKKSDDEIAWLDLRIGELRDALWREMPRKLARVMNEEDGLPAETGRWP